MKNRMKQVTDVNSFNCIAQIMLDEFVESFTFENGLKRHPQEDDFDNFSEDCIEFMLTQESQRLISKYEERLSKLGNLIFIKDKDVNNLDIKTPSIFYP